MALVVAYYRVSTARQGQSGLGLEAQQAAVAALVTRTGDELVASFTEIESGRRKDRPELLAALASCRQHKAKLVIAKLDRLARNVAFIANLIESGAEFTAADMPEANKMTIQIMAVFAEHEREAISKRTREALMAAKARGRVLGNPRPDMVRLSAAASRRAAEFHAKQLHQIEAAMVFGRSLRGAAKRLNDLGVPTLNSKRWHPQTVARMLIRSSEYDLIM